uniref:Uncharacterized protein n=1 Tax=Canis lupus familiaris TaxID=9615 RepID=A0A8P0PJG9_CANLF
SLRRLQKCPPPLRAAPDSGAPARPPSPSPGRSTGSGAAPTVLPRGGSRVHCLGGGGGGGGGGGAVSGGRGAGAGAGAGAASPRSWAARSGLCALTLRPVEAPRAESAVTRAARTTPPARPERGGGRGRGLRGGRRVRGLTPPTMPTCTPFPWRRGAQLGKEVAVQGPWGCGPRRRVHVPREPRDRQMMRTEKPGLLLLRTKLGCRSETRKETCLLSHRLQTW